MDNNTGPRRERQKEGDILLKDVVRPENKALQDCTPEEMFKELSFRFKDENDRGVAVIVTDEVGVTASVCMAPKQQASCIESWINDPQSRCG